MPLLIVALAGFALGLFLALRGWVFIALLTDFHFVKTVGLGIGVFVVSLVAGAVTGLIGYLGIVYVMDWLGKGQTGIP